MKIEFLIIFLITGVLGPVHGINRILSIDLLNPLGRDVCDYPMNPGRCFAAHRRFYFNGDTCEEFIFKGCLGNPNNFRTKQQCMDACGHKIDAGSGEAEENGRFGFSLF